MTGDRLATARTWLFVPADRPERFDKAVASGADMVIVDLEDAVAPQDKDRARAALADWLDPSRPVVVRINALDTEWAAADRATCDHPGVAAIMVPKATATTLSADAGFADRSIVALIESATGIVEAGEIAALPSVARLALGTVDLALDLGMADPDDVTGLLGIRLVLASRVAGRPAPIAGVSVSVADGAGVADHAVQAARLGFGGKLCIHPRQVDAVAHAFRPDAASLERARAIVAAYTASAGVTVALDGVMIDKPVYDRAVSLLRSA